MASAVVESSYSALVAETKQDTLNKSWKEGKFEWLASSSIWSLPEVVALLDPTDKSSFGYKMMLKMGWSEGRGLGKELQGDAKHVTLTKKIDNAGKKLIVIVRLSDPISLSSYSYAPIPS